MIPRIPPSRCTGAYDDSLLDNDRYIAEPKLDGARYMLYLDLDGAVHLYSRQRFPAIDKAANVPHIAKPYPSLKGTVLDGEMILPSQTQLGDTTGIMNSLPAKAVKQQEISGKIHYYVFDILFYNGQDVRSRPLRERRRLLELAVLEMDNECVVVVEQVADKASLFKTIVDNGGEGTVLKNLDASYGMGWVKCKRRSDFSVVISGYQQGKGKYATTLGAVLFSVYHNGALREVGKCSGMTDAERDEIWRNRTAYMGTVIDVFAQEVTKDGRMRHPVWHRVREDVEPATCTWAKMVDDAKKASLKGGDKK